MVLESASVKHALQKRYFDPWKKAEEEAAKPAVPGTKPKAAGEHNHSNPKPQVLTPNPETLDPKPRAAGTHRHS